MDIHLLKDEVLDKRFKITIAEPAIATKVDAELKRIAPTINMPGFRVGKVPLSMVVKKYQPTVRMDIIEKELQGVIEQIVKDNNLNLVKQPKVNEIDLSSGLVAEIDFEILPKITMPDFKKVKLEKINIKVTDSEVKESLQKLLESSTTYSPSSKAKAAMKDQVTLDCEGSIDGVVFEGGTLTNTKLVLGSKQFIPGFEEQLVGAKAGDEITVNVTFPADYHADLAGKDAVFKVKVTEVAKPKIPEANDEFAKLQGLENLEELKNNLARANKEICEADVFTLMKMRIFDALETLLDFPVPNSMLAEEQKGIKTQLASEAAEKNMSEEDLTAKCQKLALRRVRAGLLLAEYATIHDLKLTNNDLYAALNQQARTFGIPPQRLAEFYQNNPQGLQAMRGELLENKALQLIMDKEVAVTEKEYTIADFHKLLAEEDKKELL